MNKPIVILSALLACSVAIAVYFAMESEHERERANTLAVRAFSQEPVEKAGPPNLSLDGARDPQRQTIAPAPEIKLPNEPSVRTDEAAPRKSVLDFPGTLRTRQQVARLQARLVNRTPLEDYQIRALIEALDALEKSAHTSSKGDQARSNQMIQAASDILFESQMDEFVQLLAEGDRG